MVYFDFHAHTVRKEHNIVSLFNASPEGLCLPNDSLYTSVGVHPWYVTSIEESMQRFYKQWDYYHPIAVGEVGLDLLAQLSMKNQEILLEKLAMFAKEKGVPVIIHCVRAWAELLRIKKMFPEQLWFVHGFRGNKGLAKQLIDAGMYLSFGRYFNEEALKLAWDANRMLLETDDAPILIEDVYERIIKLLGVESLLLSTNQKSNFEYLFG